MRQAVQWRRRSVDLTLCCDSFASRTLGRGSMKVILAAAAGLGAVSMPLAAEDGPPGSATCFIEVRALLAGPPSGIADLGSAIHGLDLKLRPQVEEITRLKQVVAQLEVRHQQAMQRDEEGADPLQLEEDARKMRSDLHAR